MDPTINLDNPRQRCRKFIALLWKGRGSNLIYFRKDELLKTEKKVD